MVKLRWQNNTPISEEFADIYYSPKDGEAETRYVFIKGNNLIQRWQETALIKREESQAKGSFVICELGFGSGLNFYLTCSEFLKHAPSTLSLHYIACEKYPLSSQQIAKAMQSFISVKSSLEEFLAQYSAFDFKVESKCKNIKNVKKAQEFEESSQSSDSQESFMGSFMELFMHSQRVRLSLYFGDAYAMCKELEKRAQKIDAWFLDGFAPHKNPAMWKPEIFHSMARMAKRGSSFATFSAAGKLRRGLSEAGFQTEGIAGFGSKRHMLRGVWEKQDLL